jgi:hypothetical protein
MERAMSKPKLLENPKEVGFHRSVAAWKAAAGVSSSLTERFTHSAYREIIGMGEAAVPYLLAELEREPDWWFAALKGITGADPVPSASRGRLAEMTQAWLAWGHARGYVW